MPEGEVGGHPGRLTGVRRSAAAGEADERVPGGLRPVERADRNRPESAHQSQSASSLGTSRQAYQSTARISEPVAARAEVTERLPQPPRLAGRAAVERVRRPARRPADLGDPDRRLRARRHLAQTTAAGVLDLALDPGDPLRVRVDRDPVDRRPRSPGRRTARAGSRSAGSPPWPPCSGWQHMPPRMISAFGSWPWIASEAALKQVGVAVDVGPRLEEPGSFCSFQICQTRSGRFGTSGCGPRTRRRARSGAPRSQERAPGVEAGRRCAAA